MILKNEIRPNSFFAVSRFTLHTSEEGQQFIPSIGVKWLGLPDKGHENTMLVFCSWIDGQRPR